MKPVLSTNDHGLTFEVHGKFVTHTFFVDKFGMEHSIFIRKVHIARFSFAYDRSSMLRLVRWLVDRANATKPIPRQGNDPNQSATLPR